MSPKVADLPYRPCAGIMLANLQGQIFVGRRVDSPENDAWQMPQGGIDIGEAPRDAVMRELWEETGAVSAEHLGEWVRLLGKVLVSSPSSSPLLSCTQGRRVDVTLGDKRPYELDGGERDPARRMKFRVRPQAIAVCVP